jgi:hypothetical protein
VGADLESLGQVGLADVMIYLPWITAPLVPGKGLEVLFGEADDSDDEMEAHQALTVTETYVRQSTAAVPQVRTSSPGPWLDWGLSDPLCRLLTGACLASGCGSSFSLGSSSMECGPLSGRCVTLGFRQGLFRGMT